MSQPPMPELLETTKNAISAKVAHNYHDLMSQKWFKLEVYLILGSVFISLGSMVPLFTSKVPSLLGLGNFVALGVLIYLRKLNLGDRINKHIRLSARYALSAQQLSIISQSKDFAQLPETVKALRKLEELDTEMVGLMNAKVLDEAITALEKAMIVSTPQDSKS